MHPKHLFGHIRYVLAQLGYPSSLRRILWFEVFPQPTQPIATAPQHIVQSANAANGPVVGVQSVWAHWNDDHQLKVEET